MFRSLIAVFLILVLFPAGLQASTLNWFAGPNGTLTDGTTTVSGGTPITETLPDGWNSKQFTAVPNPGFHFRNYSGTNHFVTSTDNPISVSWDGLDHDIIANFTTDPDQIGVITHGPPEIVSMGGGMSHSFVLKKNGTITVWGGTDGQSDPALAAMTKVTAATAGPYNTFVVNNGQVQGFGKYGDAGQYPIVLPNPNPGNVVALAGGMDHTLALKSDGTVVAWGADNGYGQISPIPDFGGHKAIAIAAGHYFSMALLDNGVVKAWGQSDHGELTGNGLSNVKAIDARAWHAMALLNNGTVSCWGMDDGENTIPAGLSGVKAIAAGGHHAVAVKGDGSVVSWGANNWNQLNSPPGINGSVKNIAAGYYHVLALTDSSIVGWGKDDSTQAEVPAQAYDQVTNGSISCTHDGTLSNTVNFGSNSDCTVSPNPNLITYVAVNGVRQNLPNGPTAFTLTGITSFQTLTAAFAVPPDPPDIANVTMQNGQATVTLTPPADNGGSPITAYSVSTATPSVGIGVDLDAGTTSLTHTVTGLANGTGYSFTAKATNLVGTSVASADSRQSQVITVGTPAPTSAFYNGTFTVSATAPGGDVAYSSAGGCKNDGPLFTMTSGTTGCTVTYSQSGSAIYNAAPQITWSVAAAKIDQTITVTAGKAAPVAAPPGASFTVEASAPGGAITYGSAGGCTNVGATFTMNSATTPCTVKYDQPGGENYNPAPEVTSVTAPGKVDQVITVTAGKAAPGSASYGTSFTVDASAPGGAVVYSSAGGCTNVGPVFTMRSGSTACTVKYDQAGSDIYNPAPEVTSQTAATKADQTITVTAGKGAPASAPFGTSFTVDASAPGGAVIYASSGGCTNVGPVFTMTSGTTGCSVQYTQAGNPDYAAAPQVASVTTAVPNVPGAPVIGTPSAAVNGQASVAFTAPASDGGSPVTGYLVTANPGNLTATGTGSPIVVKGLTNGTAYTFTVAASNLAGSGAASAPSAAVIPYPNGDLNGDGVVDIKDVILALRLSVGEATATADQMNRADVAPLVDGKPKSNGKIDVGDVTVILRRAVGLVTW